MPQNPESDLDTRTRNDIRRRHAFEDVTQARLANDYGVSQARISQVVNSAYELDEMPGEKPPDDLDYVEDIRGQIAFADGLDRRPWIRDPQQMPYAELVEMCAEVIERCPEPHAVRNDVDAFKVKESVLRDVARAYATSVWALRALLGGRHPRVYDAADESLHADIRDALGDTTARLFVADIENPDDREPVFGSTESPGRAVRAQRSA